MTKYEIQTIEDNQTYGKFIFTPLENQFGITLGNGLRRVMLSAVPGGAVFAIRIDGVYHEFTGIKGVSEDVASLILKIKQLILKIDIHDNDIHTLRIEKEGPCVVYAGDIICPEGVEVLNPDLEICTLSQGGSLNMELSARLGRGYVGAETNKHMYQNDNQPLGTIYTDALYSPVKRVAYVSEPKVNDEGKEYDRLTMEIETDGTVKPSEVLSISSKILRDHLAILKNLEEGTIEEVDAQEQEKDIAPTGIQSKMIEDLELSVRSYNCLKRAGITTVEELIQKTEDEMMHVRNLGKKSLKEVKDKIYSLGLSFKSSNE
ncbi:DNA-directed RNA polymerase, alpha subunit [Firmicutes bacterium M10-2]|nr:DNA-directed RNA polymerase, alpha subunit [Firmicutes bacterium M10-2]